VKAGRPLAFLGAFSLWALLVPSEASVPWATVAEASAPKATTAGTSAPKAAPAEVSLPKAAPAEVSALKVTTPLVLKPGPKSLCPVCGMLVSKYPNWVAAIAYEGGPVFYFDGAKDMFKFLHNPSRYKAPAAGDLAKALLQVTDYYSLRPLDARTAWYVIGSKVLGPMGHELIPLASEAEARDFMKDHKGLRIVRFEEVSPKQVAELDKGVFL